MGNVQSKLFSPDPARLTSWYFGLKRDMQSLLLTWVTSYIFGGCLVWGTCGSAVEKPFHILTNFISRSQWQRGLRRRSTAASLLRSWVRIPLGTWIFVCVSVVCCKVEVSATDWSLNQGSPTDCGASLCVIKEPRTRGGSSPLEGCKIQLQWVVAPVEKT